MIVDDLSDVAFMAGTVADRLKERAYKTNSRAAWEAWTHAADAASLLNDAVQALARDTRRTP